MKADVYGLAGNVKAQVELAGAFSGNVRADLIKKAVLAEQSRERQPYGTDALAGKRTSAHYHGERHARYTMMNREMARMKRIHGSGFLSFRARFVPQAIKGRKAHPPKAQKSWVQKINQKEHMKALMSAVAAGMDRELLESRGHVLNGVKHVPLIVEDRLQELEKNRDVREALNALGLGKEMERVKEKKSRAGRGKLRNRKHIRRKGPLIIITEDKGLGRAGKNIPGLDIVELRALRVKDLAPGACPGRLCIWTKSAVSEMGKML